MSTEPEKYITKTVLEWKRSHDAMMKLEREMHKAHANGVAIALSCAINEGPTIRSANGSYYSAPDLVTAIEKIGE